MSRLPLAFRFFAWFFVIASAELRSEVPFEVARTSADVAVCNVTLYDGWYESSYSGALTEDLTDFWLFSDAELTNGQALEVISSTCLVMMSTLRLDRSGRSGPVADRYIYDVMCADECVLSDMLREEAMLSTGCTCLQLSTQPTDATYHTPGDWCRANSGRYLAAVMLSSWKRNRRPLPRGLERKW